MTQHLISQGTTQQSPYLFEVIALTPLVGPFTDIPRNHAQVVQRLIARRAQCITTAENLLSFASVIKDLSLKTEMVAAVREIMAHHHSLDPAAGE